MLSRVANAIYWMNRYMERAENVARLIDVNLNLTLDAPDMEHDQWGPLVATTGDDAAFAAKHGEVAKEKAIQFLTFDTQNPNSILSCLYAARENARSVREIISSEMWQQVNRSYLGVKDAVQSGHALDRPHSFFQKIKMDSHLFAGIMDATMSHGEAWHFGQMGRLLERADKTARILDMKYYILLPSPQHVGSPLDDLQWSAILRSASALEMYRQKRRRRVTPGDVVEFLILDPEFPRSIRYCIAKAESSLYAISGTPGRTFRNVAEKRLGRLCSELDYLDASDVFKKGLHEFLQEIQTEINYVGEGIRDSFFATRPVQVTAPRRAPAAFNPMG